MASEFGGWAGTIVGVIQGLFGRSNNGGQTSLNAFLFAKEGLTHVTNKLVDFAKLAASVFKTGAGAVKKMWERVIKPALGRIITAVKWLHDHLAKWFGPILRWLSRVRDAVKKIYKRWVEPILTTIDVIRKIARVLAFFGWDAAKKVDAKLGAVEDKLTQPFLIVTKKLNEVINWIDRIVTLNGLFQRVMLLNSLIGYKGDVMNFTVNSINHTMTDADFFKYNFPVKTMTPEEHAGDLLNGLENHEGDWVALAQEQGDDLVRLLNDRRAA